jgi:hypothetical protein
MRSFSSRIGALVLLVALGSSALMISGSITRILEFHHSTFNETSWFPVLHDVVINTTTGSLYLTGAPLIYEDFNVGWAESDPSNRLTHSQYVSTFTNLDRGDIDTYFYEDINTQNFDWFFRLRMTKIDNSISTNRFTVIGVSNRLDDWQGVVTNSATELLILLRSSYSVTEFRLLLGETVAGATNFFNAPSNNLNINTDYYIRFTKSGTALSMHIYTDPGYSTEESDYTGGVHGVLSGNWNLPYIMLPQSNGQSGGIGHSGTLSYLTKNALAGYTASGVAYSQDLLGNETDPGAGYSVMTNHTQGAGGSLSIAVSSDNSTWIPVVAATSGGIHYSRIEALNYTSLYCRVNLTSLGVTNTILNDFYFTHLYEVEEAPPEGLDLMYLLAAVICVGLGALATRPRKPG